jgi:hypothetical protein
MTIRQRKRRNGVLLFAGDAQWLPAGHQHAEPEGCCKQLSDRRRRLDDLLEVVQDEQHLVLLDIVDQHFANRARRGLPEAEPRRRRRQHEVGI